MTPCCCASPSAELEVYVAYLLAVQHFASEQVIDSLVAATLAFLQDKEDHVG